MNETTWSGMRTAAALWVVRGAARALALVHPAEIRRRYGASFPDVAEDRWRRERQAGRGAFGATASTLAVLVVDAAKARGASRTGAAAPHRAPPSGGASLFDRAARSTRQATRQLGHSPLVTVVATASLAIGLGVNVAVFTAANTLLLARTPGVADADRVVDVGRTTNGGGFDTVSYMTYTALRDQNRVFTSMFAMRGEPRAVNIGSAGGGDRAYADQVSASFFDVLGVRPALGAFFHTSDEHLGVPLRQVVLSRGFWRRQFDGDAAIAGRAIVVNGDRFTIAGVAPEGFHGTTVLSPDLWIPLTAYAQATPTDDLLRSRESSWLLLGARLRDGVSIRQARADLDAIQRRLAASYPEIYANRGIVVTPASRLPGEAGDFARPFLTLLLALTGLVLAVTCANLASLLLARAAGRSREVAVRRALGASRGALAGMFLTETVVLFVPGAVAAVLVARALAAVLAGMTAQLPVPVAADFRMDWRVLGFAAALSLGAALATGLLPAWQSSRANIVPDLKADVGAPRRQRLRGVFVAGQLACCLVLMTIAGLLARGLQAATAIDPGFRLDGIDVAGVDLTLAGYDRDRSADVTERLRARLSALPGVRSVSMAAVVPLSDTGLGLGSLRRAGDTSAQPLDADWNVITPAFLPALRLPVVAGRNFSDADRKGAPGVALVNERLAEELWPGQRAVGRTIEAGDFRAGRESSVQRLTVVGVVRQAKYRGLAEAPRGFIYVPLAQTPWLSLHVFLERDPAADADTAPLGPEIRQALRDVDRTLPLIDLTPLRQYADLGLLPERLAASVAGTLGLVALALGVIGVYGVTAFAVATRTRDIGLRIALGAGRARVLRGVMRQAIGLLAIGGSIGLAAALGVSRLLADWLFGVSPLDPVSLGGTALLLSAATVAAAWVPARRATRIDPIAALRAD